MQGPGPRGGGCGAAPARPRCREEPAGRRRALRPRRPRVRFVSAGRPFAPFSAGRSARRRLPPPRGSQSAAALCARRCRAVPGRSVAPRLVLPPVLPPARSAALTPRPPRPGSGLSAQPALTSVSRRGWHSGAPRGAFGASRGGRLRPGRPGRCSLTAPKLLLCLYGAPSVRAARVAVRPGVPFGWEAAPVAGLCSQKQAQHLRVSPRLMSGDGDSPRVSFLPSPSIWGRFCPSEGTAVEMQPGCSACSECCVWDGLTPHCLGAVPRVRSSWGCTRAGAVPTGKAAGN